MRTLQSQLVKHRNFLSTVRQLDLPKEKKMEQQTINSRVTAKASNKRYKRSSEELDRDVQRVDELVASGKFNQIEALNEVGLQSSVYHYRKRNANEAVAKSLKPRKFAPRPNRRSNKENYQQRKAEAMQKLEVAPVVERRSTIEADSLKAELAALKAKYAKMQEVVEVLLK